MAANGPVRLTGSARAGSAAPGATEVPLYDFRRPDRFSKEQIRSLVLLYDRFARNMATSLSAYLRAAAELTVVSVEQITYSEFLMSLPDPTVFYAVDVHPVEVLGALELNPSITYAVIDRMLGGAGNAPPIDRGLTEIEQNVVDAVVKLILESMSDTWRAVIEVQFRVQARETRPQMLQIAAPNDAVVLLVCDVKVGEATGLLNFCLPAAALGATGLRFAQGWQPIRRERTASDREHLNQNLARVPVAVSTVLETTITALDVVRLRAGDIVTLGWPVKQPLDLRVGGVSRFRGRPVRSEQGSALEIESRVRPQGDM